MSFYIRNTKFYTCLAGLLFMFGCLENPLPSQDAISETLRKPAEKRDLTKEFKNYWYDGTAEITSYKLQQNRYGELREGTTTLIYVTEPFLKDKQVKPNVATKETISVLKLNTSTKFITGIYPYSIMNSAFYPLQNQDHAIKVSNSIQEWCGHVYTQLNLRNKVNITRHSYFEQEADSELLLEQSALEDELWLQIKVAPETLPVGEIELLPSLTYLGLNHKKIKSYKATTALVLNDEIFSYSITYPELSRKLNITFSATFPYGIQGWTETIDVNRNGTIEQYITTAKKNQTIKVAYWQKNKNSDVTLRDSLGL